MAPSRPKNSPLPPLGGQNWPPTPKKAGFWPKNGQKWGGRAHFWVFLALDPQKTALFWPKMANFWPKRATFWLKMAIFSLPLLNNICRFFRKKPLQLGGGL